MSRKNKRRRKPGNIKNDPAYNPFPKSGLVKQYERYIRGVVGEFCRRYSTIRRDDFLFRALELASAAEKTFKPELGNDFSTYLGGFARNGRLKELHRLYDQQEKEQGVEIYRTAEDLAHEAAEEAGEPTDAVSFGGGGNGVRLLFDLQWWEALLSDIGRYIDPGPMLRRQRWFSEGKGRIPYQNDNGLVESQTSVARAIHRLKLGLQLRKSDSGLAIHERISADLPEVVREQPPSSVMMGWIRAAADHLIRRQREADDEAEKRQSGDHSPTFLEAERNAADVRFYKGRRSPRFLPKWQPMARLDDAYSHQDGDSPEKATLHDVTYSPDALREAAAEEERKQEVLAKMAATRPELTNKSEIDMLDALEAQVRGDADGSLVEVAKEIGITKGAASKVVRRLKRAVGRK